MEGRKFRSRDFSTHGVMPNLKIAQLRPPPEKRQKIDQAQEEARSKRTIYTHLKTRFDKEMNPTKGATLFGVIYELSAQLYGCRGSYECGKWPCPATYHSQVIEIEVPTEVTENEAGEEDVAYMSLNMSILENSRDFFLNLRSIKNNKTCCQKIIPDLIPTFSPDDKVMDQRRIEVLLHFLGSVFEKFIDKIPKGTFRSPLNSSRTSTESSTEEFL